MPDRKEIEIKVLQIFRDEFEIDNPSRDEPLREVYGFDSIDERMERVPFDLRNDDIRKDYLVNHIRWFLQHHNGSIEKFNNSVEEMYGDRIINARKNNTDQMALFQ